MTDFEDKYNTDMLAVNANIVSQITKAMKFQDEKIKEWLKDICYVNDQSNTM